MGAKNEMGNIWKTEIVEYSILSKIINKQENKQENKQDLSKILNKLLHNDII